MKTSIEWVVNPGGSQGYTWNPVTGCRKECDYCYAKKIAMRFQGNFEPKFHPERLNDPLKIKKPSTIFVGSMSDVFGDWVPSGWIEQVFDIVRKCPQHTFLFLTKNPQRYFWLKFPSNCWAGYTGTNGLSGAFQSLLCSQGNSNKYKYFVSAEPLLDYAYLYGAEGWVIIGTLNSGKNPVPSFSGGTKKEWVLSLIKQADNRGIPVFIKDSLYKLYPDLPQRRELPYLKHENTFII